MIMQGLETTCLWVGIFFFFQQNINQCLAYRKFGRKRKKAGLLSQSLISVLCMYISRFAGCHAPKLAPENLLRCAVKLLFKISPKWQTEGKLLFKITKANWYLKSAQDGTLQRCLVMPRPFLTISVIS